MTTIFIIDNTPFTVNRWGELEHDGKTGEL